MAFVTSMVLLLQAYSAVGVVFALAFVMKGAGRVDPTAQTGTWGFRVLIFPGAAALWPWLMSRWLRAPREPNAAEEVGS